MKPMKYSNDKISLGYKGASVFATGTLAKVITYSFAGLLLLIGIAVIQSSRTSK
jgi:hypothetical protein